VKASRAEYKSLLFKNEIRVMVQHRGLLNTQVA